MAGTVTITYDQSNGPVKKVKFDWLSDGDGNATATSKVINGVVLRVGFTPDSGDLQPTNAYDVTLTDDEGFDILQGLGVDLSNATPSDIIPVVTNGTDGNMSPIAINDTLDLSVSGAGAANAGEVVLWIR